MIFIGVQIGHPHLDAASVTTTEVVVRDSLKVLMAVLALVGITGMYLRQVRADGVLGLVGYLLLGAGYLVIMCISFVAAFVLPAIAGTDPGYVDDVLAAATTRHRHRRHRAAAEAIAGPGLRLPGRRPRSSASRCTGPASSPAGPPRSSPSVASSPSRSP